MPDAHKNFAYSTILTAPSPASSGTSLVVQSGDGAKFPAVSFNATVWPAGAQTTTLNSEIVRVTTISTDTFTITRAQESSSARSIVVGDQIAATVTSKTLTDAEIQVVDVLSTAVATGTTLLPYDDTIPQNTEGDQYLTVSITPRTTTSKLYIEARVQLANSAANQRITAALFQDSTANALAAGTTVNITANTGIPVMVYHSMTSGTTSSTAFKIRAGANNAGTTTLNGDSGNRAFGGITQSYLRITEVPA